VTPDVAPFADVGRERLDRALQDVSPVPFAETYRLDPAGARRWMGDQFEEAASDPAAQALVAVERDQVVGGLVVRRAAFESEIYDMSMARVPLTFVTWEKDWHRGYRAAMALRGGLDDLLDAWGVRHCSVLVRADETPTVHALGDAGWRLVDSTLEVAFEAGRTTATPAADVTLRATVADDEESLAGLARIAYTRLIRSRYTADPDLPVERTGRLYEEWFRRACAGSFADMVVVAEHRGRPVGFTTCKLDAALSKATGVGFATDGIGAVEPDARGLRLQPAMLHWLAEWQRGLGGRFRYGRVLINNYPMQRACLRCGGFITQGYHTFHVSRGGARRR